MNKESIPQQDIKDDKTIDRHSVDKSLLIYSGLANLIVK